MNKEIEEKARAILNDPKLMNATRVAWTTITERIHDRATKAKPKPKVYEVSHETFVARDAFLGAVVEGKTMDDAMYVALDRVKIGYVRNEAGRFLRWAA